jgi:hypothetical protein
MSVHHRLVATLKVYFIEMRLIVAIIVSIIACVQRTLVLTTARKIQS